MILQISLRYWFFPVNLGLRVSRSFTTLLSQKASNWMEQKFQFNISSFENNSSSELQKYCNDLISKGPDKLLRSLISFQFRKDF